MSVGFFYEYSILLMILTINYLNAGVNLSELGVLFAFAIDQIPRTHLTIL